MVAGFVRKKKAKVMWKKEREVRIVLADMRAILGESGEWPGKEHNLRSLRVGIPV
jgi:hypothetical protein